MQLPDGESGTFGERHERWISATVLGEYERRCHTKPILPTKGKCHSLLVPPGFIPPEPRMIG
jgi:hypothetical protein